MTVGGFRPSPSRLNRVNYQDINKTQKIKNVYRMDNLTVLGLNFTDYFKNGIVTQSLLVSIRLSGNKTALEAKCVSQFVLFGIENEA